MLKHIPFIKAIRDQFLSAVLCAKRPVLGCVNMYQELTKWNKIKLGRVEASVKKTRAGKASISHTREHTSLRIYSHEHRPSCKIV